MPFCVLVLGFLAFFFAAIVACCTAGNAVVSDSVPCSALMIVPLGILVSSVSGMKTPCTSINTRPVDDTLNVLPSPGAPGTGPRSVLNVMSGPFVVPAALVATRRTWYSALGTRPETDADTEWLEKSEPTG